MTHLKTTYIDKEQWPDESHYKFILTGTTAQEREQHRRLKDIGFRWDGDSKCWRKRRLSRTQDDCLEIEEVRAIYSDVQVEQSTVSYKYGDA